MTVATLSPRIRLAACVLLLAACEAGTGTAPTFGRPDDGLRNDADLQALVDAQTRRDVAPLIEALANPDPLVRARAAFGLASVQDERARSHLLGLLEDDDARVRADAAFALGQLSDTTGTEALVERLDEESDSEVRLRLIEAAGKAGGRGAEALLLRADLRSGEQAAFALALARFGLRGLNNTSAIETLVELTGHSDPDVRTHAAWYFARSSGSSFWTPVSSRLRGRMAELAFDDPAGEWLLRALEGITTADDVEVGLRWLASGASWRSRIAAIQLLGNHRGIGRIKTGLSAALSDPSAHVRLAAAQALAARGDELTEAERLFVVTWMEEHAEDVHSTTALLPILGRRTAGQPIVEWMDQFPTDHPAQAPALHVLAGFPGPIAREALIAAAREGTHRLVALEALAARGPGDRTDPDARQAVFDVGREALASNDGAEVQLAAGLLGTSDFVELGAADALAETWEAWGANAPTEVTIALASALGAVGDADHMPPIREALASPARSVRLAAFDALRTMGGSPPTPDLTVDPPDRMVDWDRLSRLGTSPQVVLETEHGEVTLALDPSGAPLSTLTFADLVESGALDGTVFHRVVPAFVAQGGDLAGGGGYGVAPFRIRSEFTRASFREGTLGMASSGKDTEATQFFVTHLMTPHLDGAYTAFGRVVAGMEVLNQILPQDRIVSARLQVTGS